MLIQKIKKLLVIVTILGSTNKSYSQNTFPSTGNVGIGTTSPSKRLEIVSPCPTGCGLTDLILRNSGSADVYTGTAVGFAIGSGDPSGAIWYRNSNLSNGRGEFHFALNSSTSSTGVGYTDTKMVILNDGKVGVGTTTPSEKLSVAGNIAASGKVLIGSVDINKTGAYSLAVNGSAVFTKVVVKTYANWPDYVFEPSYKLRSIESVENYIKSYKHLPGIPSAADVEKEGTDVGAMQANLLLKLEELTLYMIELKKENSRLAEEVNKLNKKLGDGGH